MSQNYTQIKKKKHFNQLSNQKQNKIIDRTHHLAQTNKKPSKINQHITKHINQNIKTIHYTLKQFNYKHPNITVFPNHTNPLTNKTKQKLYQQFQHNTSINTLTKQHAHTKTNIYHIINKIRTQQILNLPLNYIPNPNFSTPNIKHKIFNIPPKINHPKQKSKPPTKLPPYLKTLYKIPLLNQKQKKHLFHKFNYLKYTTNKLQTNLNTTQTKNSLINKIKHLYNQTIKIKNQIIQTNLQLIISITKHHINSNIKFFKLINNNNISLIHTNPK